MKVKLLQWLEKTNFGNKRDVKIFIVAYVVIALLAVFVADNLTFKIVVLSFPFWFVALFALLYYIRRFFVWIYKRVAMPAFVLLAVAIVFAWSLVVAGILNTEWFGAINLRWQIALIVGMSVGIMLFLSGNVLIWILNSKFGFFQKKKRKPEVKALRKSAVTAILISAVIIGVSLLLSDYRPTIVDGHANFASCLLAVWYLYLMSAGMVAVITLLLSVNVLINAAIQQTSSGNKKK